MKTAQITADYLQPYSNPSYYFIHSSEYQSMRTRIIGDAFQTAYFRSINAASIKSEIQKAVDLIWSTNKALAEELYTDEPVDPCTLPLFQLSAEKTFSIFENAIPYFFNHLGYYFNTTLNLVKEKTNKLSDSQASQLLHKMEYLQLIDQFYENELVIEATEMELLNIWKTSKALLHSVLHHQTAIVFYMADFVEKSKETLNKIYMREQSAFNTLRDEQIKKKEHALHQRMGDIMISQPENAFLVHLRNMEESAVSTRSGFIGHAAPQISFWKINNKLFLGERDKLESQMRPLQTSDFRLVLQHVFLASHDEDSLFLTIEILELAKTSFQESLRNEFEQTRYYLKQKLNQSNHLKEIRSLPSSCIPLPRPGSTFVPAFDVWILQISNALNDVFSIIHPQTKKTNENGYSLADVNAIYNHWIRDNHPDKNKESNPMLEHLVRAALEKMVIVRELWKPIPEFRVRCSNNIKNNRK